MTVREWGRPPVVSLGALEVPAAAARQVLTYDGVAWVAGEVQAAVIPAASIPSADVALGVQGDFGDVTGSGVIAGAMTRSAGMTTPGSGLSCFVAAPADHAGDVLGAGVCGFIAMPPTAAGGAGTFSAYQIVGTGSPYDYAVLAIDNPLALETAAASGDDTPSVKIGSGAVRVEGESGSVSIYSGHALTATAGTAYTAGGISFNAGDAAALGAAEQDGASASFTLGDAASGIGGGPANGGGFYITVGSYGANGGPLGSFSMANKLDSRIAFVRFDGPSDIDYSGFEANTRFGALLGGATNIDGFNASLYAADADAQPGSGLGFQGGSVMISAGNSAVDGAATAGGGNVEFYPSAGLGGADNGRVISYGMFETQGIQLPDAGGGAAGDDSFSVQMVGFTSASKRSLFFFNECDAGTDTYRFKIVDDSNIHVASLACEAGIGTLFGVSNTGLQIATEAGAVLASVVAASCTLTPPALQWAKDVIAPSIVQLDETDDVAGDDTIYGAQGCVNVAGTKQSGSSILRGGIGTNGNKQGNVAIGAAPASWDGLQRGVFIADAAGVPAGNPANGAWLYSNGGALTLWGAGGAKLACNVESDFTGAVTSTSTITPALHSESNVVAMQMFT